MQKEITERLQHKFLLAMQQLIAGKPQRGSILFFIIARRRQNLSDHSRPHSLRSFWPAAGIESSGSNHFEVTKEITEFCPSGFNAVCIYGAFLKWYSCRRPEGSQALGTRMLSDVRLKTCAVDCILLYPGIPGCLLKHVEISIEFRAIAQLSYKLRTR